MSETKHLLDSKQMAFFAANGYLRFDELVPSHLNEAMVAGMEAGEPKRMKAGTPLSEIWQDRCPAGQVFRMPEVEGIIHSLVGPNPLYDHHAVHIVEPGTETGQVWHGDAIIDTRLHFDIQFFYFAHDTPREMGGTMILPGSHYRRINEGDISRYQNFKGQLPMVCRAGTLAVVHHGMWHCAQPNLTNDVRSMFKLRLNPTVRQMRLWNTEDLDDPKVNEILGSAHAWTGMEHRLEYINRIKFWRFLLGDESFDLNYWMSRIENMPEDDRVAACRIDSHRR
jgi:hypothetical protein